MGTVFAQAARLLFSGDREVYFIAWTSLRFVTMSVLISSAFGVPAAIALALSSFSGRKFVISIINSLMAMPTVVIGLAIYSLLTRSGPLGRFDLLYTPAAVILGQSVMCLPIIVSFVSGGLSALDPIFRETLVTLGARRRHIIFATVIETRPVLVSSVLAGFGRVIGEIGVSMMLGGNIRWYTRTLTTAIALQSSRGEIELGLALGMVLLFLALIINVLLNLVAGRR